ncbi:MAG: extracellular solute-binding protein [Fibrobacteraceae bacterium]|nr:extracellular solute-binding protein [Fibrobacteraceae bacterium]
MRILFSIFVLSSAIFSFAAPKDTLQFWCMPNGPSSQSVLEKNLQGFTKETNIPVKLGIVDWSEAFLKIKNSFESGKGPDVVQLGTSWVSYFSSKGDLYNLSHLIPLIDSSRFIPSALYPAKVEGLAGIYAFPWFLDVRALFINKKFADTLEISDSSLLTMAAFLGTLQYIADAHLHNEAGLPVVPFGLPGKDDRTGHQQLAPFIWNEGGDYLEKTSSGWKSALLNRETLLGIAEYVRILKDSSIATFSLRDNTSQLTNRFTNGEQAFLFGTSEIIRKLDLPISEYGLKSSAIGESGIYIFPFPAGSKGNSTFIGGSLLAISNKSNHKKQAEQLLAYLLRPDNINIYTKRIGFLPGDQSLLRVWSRDARYKKLVKSLENGRTFPNIPEWAAIESDLIDMTNEIGALYRSPISRDGDKTTSLAILISKYDAKINQRLNQKGSVKDLSSIIAILETQIKIDSFIPHKPSYKKHVSEPEEHNSKALNIFFIIFIILCLTIIFISKKKYSSLLQQAKKKKIK